VGHCGVFRPICKVSLMRGPPLFVLKIPEVPPVIRSYGNCVKVIRMIMQCKDILIVSSFLRTPKSMLKAAPIAGDTAYLTGNLRECSRNGHRKCPPPSERRRSTRVRDGSAGFHAPPHPGALVPPVPKRAGRLGRSGGAVVSCDFAACTLTCKPRALATVSHQSRAQP
jgi:hypothetical protein